VFGADQYAVIQVAVAESGFLVGASICPRVEQAAGTGHQDWRTIDRHTDHLAVVQLVIGKHVAPGLRRHIVSSVSHPVR
jgi:hypothetical protein